MEIQYSLVNLFSAELYVKYLYSSVCAPVLPRGLDNNIYIYIFLECGSSEESTEKKQSFIAAELFLQIIRTKSIYSQKNSILQYALINLQINVKALNQYILHIDISYIYSID